MSAGRPASARWSRLLPGGRDPDQGDFLTQVSRRRASCGHPPRPDRPDVHQGPTRRSTRARCTGWSAPTRSTAPAVTLTSQGYVSPLHEDLSMPAMAPPRQRRKRDHAVHADRQRRTDPGRPRRLLTRAPPSPADQHLPAAAQLHRQHRGSGAVPQDGFTEYQGYPGPTRPGGRLQLGALRTGHRRILLRQQLHPVPELPAAAFTLANATCGGTRNGMGTGGPRSTTSPHKKDPGVEGPNTRRFGPSTVDGVRPSRPRYPTTTSFVP